jgi:hypothetical protein
MGTQQSTSKLEYETQANLYDDLKDKQILPPELIVIADEYSNENVLSDCIYVSVLLTVF